MGIMNRLKPPAELVELVTKFNPHHGKGGRFASGPGGGISSTDGDGSVAGSGGGPLVPAAPAPASLANHNVPDDAHSLWFAGKGPRPVFTKKNTKEFLAAEGKRMGLEFTDKHLDSAMAKSQRWMKNAFGGSDWNAEDGQVRNTAFYLKETIEGEAGKKDTINRSFNRQRRSNLSRLR